jgi:hypothetical protein
MITMVISGGQTGADQAGWRAAEACGIFAEIDGKSPSKRTALQNDITIDST